MRERREGERMRLDVFQLYGTKTKRRRSKSVNIKNIWRKHRKRKVENKTKTIESI